MEQQKYAIYWFDCDHYEHPERDGICASLEIAQDRIDEEVLYFRRSMWRGAAYPLDNEPKDGNHTPTYVQDARKYSEDELAQAAETLQLIKETKLVAQGARYYVCEFAQEGGWGNALVVRTVLSPEGYTSRQIAERHAAQTEQKFQMRRVYDMVIHARLAASYQDAQEGRFLDE